MIGTLFFVLFPFSLKSPWGFTNTGAGRARLPSDKQKISILAGNALFEILAKISSKIAFCTILRFRIFVSLGTPRIKQRKERNEKQGFSFIEKPCYPVKI